jgi:superfamily II DNA or RNA helicase
MKSNLKESINTSFIDKSINSLQEYQAKIIHNCKESEEKILSTLLKELETCEEFFFSVAFITNSGVATIINTLKELEQKGIKGKILTSQYLNFTEPIALKRLKEFKNIELKISINESFHAKGFLFKKQEDIYSLIIGSSNLTQSALTTNKEWNLKVSTYKDSQLIDDAKNIFDKEFEVAQIVDDELMKLYEELYLKHKEFSKVEKQQLSKIINKTIEPNSMQKEALLNIKNLRDKNIKKALLISATGTGKTFLSAFDVRESKPEKFLFIVHRLNIAKKAMETFKTILPNISMGIYSGNQKNITADYIFSTIQTISRDNHLTVFKKDEFDYIVIDESHKAGANSYIKIMDYFTPKFMLGMTATPQRSDDINIFELFDYNIAYEIRLQQALNENLLVPFHYYGISDFTLDEETIDNKSDFNLLVDEKRVNHIIEKINFYGTSSGIIKGLIFCSRQEECQRLSELFNQKGFCTTYLIASHSEDQREDAIKKLESDKEKLQYIFTVDIFNEGIDIPKVNQVIMLRPTQSAIVFIQQLGRGLRKDFEKSYLTVIDFIGNYDNNYLIPIALYGDNSYNKDRLRRLISSGNRYLAGACTINFDKISKERIFKNIDNTNLNLKRLLKEDYDNLKNRINKIPMLMDFYNTQSRTPFSYINEFKSYYNFLSKYEDKYKGLLKNTEIKVLELFSQEINNGKRVEESLILSNLLKSDYYSIDNLKSDISLKFGYEVIDQTIESCLNNLNFGFVNKKQDLIESKNNKFFKTQQLKQMLSNKTFFSLLDDSINLSLRTFEDNISKNKILGGFILYNKYSRKDIFRILNWELNPVANFGGYIIDKNRTHCPIFINYHKDESISNSIKYDNVFQDKTEITWSSKPKRTLDSADVIDIKSNGLRLLLFIRKSNDEGVEYYYMGDVKAKEDSFFQTTIKNNKNQDVNIVKSIFCVDEVDEELYDYFHNNSS